MIIETEICTINNNFLIFDLSRLRAAAVLPPVDAAGPAAVQLPQSKAAGPFEEVYQPPGEIVYEGFRLSTVEEEDEPGLLDTTLPGDLPPSMQPDLIGFYGYTTPEKLKPAAMPLQSTYILDSPVMPCDIECSPVQLHEPLEEFQSLGDFVPPTPPDSPPLRPASPPSPVPMQQITQRRSPQQLPSQRISPQMQPELPQMRLSVSPRAQLPEVPSFLVAEQGSPEMLQEISPQQVYDVQTLDDAFLESEDLGIDGEYFM